MHFVYLDYDGDDRAQAGEGFGEVPLLLERVARIADEYRDPDAAVDRLTEQRQDCADASGDPRRPLILTPLQAAPLISMNSEALPF